jgi:circadian clock protein KaiC
MPPPIDYKSKREAMQKSEAFDFSALGSLPKAPTGIDGFDDITFGGLPKGRPTLVCGGAGSGKTLFAMEFLVRGAVEYGEHGVFMSFEESDSDLAANFASLGFDLKALEAQKKIGLDYVHIERSEIEETGEFDLEGLFVRLGFAVDAIGAQRVVLDTLESLFSGFTNEAILRAEIRRLFRWIKDRGLTAVITAEKGDRPGSFTRHGLEEYVSDCVIVLDHRVSEQLSTRRMRVAKYRGTVHGTNEYPFLIDEGGLSVMPITSVGLEYKVSSERISSGMPRIDDMFGGLGFFRGSSVLVSGTAGTGKSSFAAHFAHETCRRGEKCLYYAFEESSDQIMRNMRSIGLDLAPDVDAGLLHFRAIRPNFHGLEMHLTLMHKDILKLRPTVIVIDPISNMVNIATPYDVKSALMRLVDLLKSRNITSMFTSLGEIGGSEDTDIGMSSLMDTWILLKEIESSGERNRGIYIMKSRGMAHSNQIREFVITDQGIDIIEPYAGLGGVLTGTARIAQEAVDQAEELRKEQEVARHSRDLDRKRAVIEARIAMLRSQLASEEADIQKIVEEHELRKKSESGKRKCMADLRDGRHQGE